MQLFAGFDQQQSEPWPVKWYGGVIIPEFEKSGMTGAVIHKTEDKVGGQDGTSRNLKMCVTCVRGKEQQKFTYTVNYRPEILTPERQKELIAARERFKDVRGAWPDKDLQRDNLSAIRLHALEKAGIPLEVNGKGGFDVDVMIGKPADWYLQIHKMESGDTKNSKPVPREILTDKNTTNEEKRTWFNKIGDVAPIDTKNKD
jgi:hypothetical protein